MATWRINNSTLLGGEVCAQWQPDHVYALGARVVCRIAYGTVARRAHVYESTTGGTSGGTGSEPTWPASGTVADGPDTLVWTTRNPNDGDWNNASCILHYILNHAATAAGDSVYIDDGHSEDINMAAAYTVLGSNALNNPIKMYCVDKTDDSLSVGAVIFSNGQILRFQGYFYSYGVTYKGTTGISFNAPGLGIFEHNGGLLFHLTANIYTLTLGYAGNGIICPVINGNIQFDNLGNYISPYPECPFHWKGGSLISATGVTKLFDGTYIRGIVEDVDLSQVGNGATATSLVDVATNTFFDILFLRCKLPSDAGFTLTTGTWGIIGGGRVRLHHCSSANKTYDFYEQCYQGSIEDEIIIVRIGGASDGTTPQSWKMISSANVVDNINPLKSPPIVGWTDSVAEKTFTIEGIYDSATNLQNDEVWMEFEYPANATDGLGAFSRDKCEILGTPADKTVSTESWVSTGITNVNRFKCKVTVTPGKAGPITARICLAKPSTTIYIDPIVTES